MLFRNRSEAAQRLAGALLKYRGQPVTILALPRGGVSAAANVADAIEAPLDLIFARKVGVPFQPDLVMLLVRHPFGQKHQREEASS